MIQRYILRPRNTGSIRFKAIIDRSSKGGKKYALTRTYDLLEIVDDRVPDNVLTIDFNPSTRATYEISYDDVCTEVVDRKKREAVAYLAEAMLVKPDYVTNPFMGNDYYFILENVSARSISCVTRDQKVVKALTKWYGYTPEEKAMCAYYFGVNPNMTESELSYLMAGLAQTSAGTIVKSEGKLISAMYWDDQKPILDYFIENYASDEHQLVRSTFKRALIEKYIIQKNAEYHLDKKDGSPHVFIGMTEAEAVLFLKDNRVTYEYIKGLMDVKCPVIPDLTDPSKSPVVRISKTSYHEELRELAKEHDIQNVNTKGVKRLEQDLKRLGVKLPGEDAPVRYEQALS